MNKAEAKRQAWTILLSLAGADVEDGDYVANQYPDDQDKINAAIEECLNEMARKTRVRSRR